MNERMGGRRDKEKDKERESWYYGRFIIQHWFTSNFNSYLDCTSSLLLSLSYQTTSSSLFYFTRSTHLDKEWHWLNIRIGILPYQDTIISVMSMKTLLRMISTLPVRFVFLLLSLPSLPYILSPPIQYLPLNFAPGPNQTDENRSTIINPILERSARDGPWRRTWYVVLHSIININMS